MIKKTTTIFITLVLLISFNLVLKGEDVSRRANLQKLRHAKFSIQLAEKNLFPVQLLLRVKDKIGLDEKQVSRLEKLDLAFKEESIKRQADINILQLKLGNYLKSDKINRSQAEKLIREIAKMRTDLHVSRINHLLDVKESLTPGQLTKLEELRTKFRRERFKSKKDRPFQHQKR